jgi:hypothetical protein
MKGREKMASKKVLICAAAIVLSALGACGGGGGSGGSSEATAPVTTYPIAAAERNWLRTGKSYGYLSPPGSLAGTSLTVTPLASVQLPALSSSAVERTSIYLTMSVNVQPSSIFRSVEYYESAPLRYLGSSAYDTDPVTPADQTTAMPETATVGASGPLYTLPASGNAYLTFQASVSWSLEADTAQTAWLCHHYMTQQTPVGGGTGRVDDQRVCLKIDPAGNVSDFKT